MNTSILIECVPNFSEGRDEKKIAAIVSAIQSVQSVKVLHVDSGFDANRTVVTFLGAPDAVCEAAFRAIQSASELIDMRTQHGIHPRLGATDVCPFIPVKNISLEKTAVIARTLGARVGAELKIPVYLYEAAATNKYRKNLADIRKNEYEGLEEKIKDSRWQPDFFPHFNARSGATVIGARPFLIAFNVNLNTSDVNIAKHLAAAVREKPSKNFPNGGLKAVKAIGWFVDAYNCAQVSLNLVDFNITPPHIAYEAIKTLAALHGIEVTGSELIGLMPLHALQRAADYYSSKSSFNQDQKIKFAIEKLGLNALQKFKFSERVIENLI